MPLTPSSVVVFTGRRSLLARAVGSLSAVCGVGALGAAAGCSADGGSGGGSGSGSDGERTPEERQLRASAARRSRALLRRYDGTADVHASLAEPLKPLRAAVARHAQALADEQGAKGGSDGGSGGGKGRGSEEGARDRAGSKESEVHPKPAVPKEEKAALDALADAERRTAREHTAALADAPPELAVLLASVAAAGSAHAYLLSRGTKGLEKPEGDDR
jgi:hypothetical protein